jgi:hypothetical protein
MSIRHERAGTSRRGLSAAVVLTVIMALLAGMAGSAAAAVAPPSPPAAAARALAPMSADTPADDGDDFDRQLVEDIAAHAADPEVRQAAQAALDSHDPAQITYFLDHGEADAKARAAARKAREAAHNKELVQGWAQTGGPKVRAAAQAALAAGDDQSLADFVLYGHEIADKQDQQDQADAKAEQDRITGRVKDMVANGGPTVKVEGAAALASNDYDRIKAFYLTGYADANKRDHDFQAAIEKALADRTKAVKDLEDLANRTAAAAQARAEILRANIEAIKDLDDATLAMKQAATFAHRADEIVQEDMPGRAHGQLGRTADIDSLRAQAAQQADIAARASQSAHGTTAAVQNAAVDLLHTGMTNGLDWAKVTIAVGAAVEASAQATATAQHAAEAALADSRALDADNKAEQHANNAAKWRAETERQAQTAADLATAAKQQQDIAIGARDRAQAQQVAAENAAAQARQHAANARAARVNAQGASSNAVDKANAAVDAGNAALRDSVREQAAIDARNATANELKTASTAWVSKQNLADQVEGALKAARDQAIREGKDADEATKDIAADAARARAAANDAGAWADRARSAAATAQAEANAAADAARRSRAAAAQAAQEAQTARRAADDANQLAVQAANVAMNTKAAADQTRFEAEGAVTEASQAVYQAGVADRAADAAAASASMVIDPAHMADVIAKPYADINGDARQALAAAADAVTISADLAKGARDRATEADQAADRAKKAADAAIADVKPAYDAAARAAQSAQQAAQYAVGAVDAANAAAGYAHNANVAATNATNSASAAGVDAAVANRAADFATNAAKTANQAADGAAKILVWATNATNAIHDFSNAVGSALDKFEDLKAKAAEAERMAKEEAERKRQELNHQFLELNFQATMCELDPVSIPCAQLAKKLGDALVTGIGATTDFVLDGIHCQAGDAAACKRFNDATLKINDFMTKAANGFLEGAKNFWDGLSTLSQCVDIVNFDIADKIPSCYQIATGIADLLKNPYKIIHLDVWHDDPGRAFGLTAFDVLSTLVTTPIGGEGSVVGKVLDSVASALARTTTRLVDGVGNILGTTAKVVDDTGKVVAEAGQIINAGIRIENGIAKIEAAEVFVNGDLRELEPAVLHTVGDLSKLDGVFGRVENAVVQIADDGRVILKDGTFKIDPLPEGAMPPGADNLSEVVDGAWHGREYGKDFNLNAADTQAVQEAFDRANAVAPTMKAKMEELVKKVPGSELAGTKHQVKSLDSLRRKVASDLKNPGDTAAEALAGIKDMVRYTLTLPEKDYKVLAERVIDQLKTDGYQELSFKNFWEINGTNGKYLGINIGLYDPAAKVSFELQLHTPASYFAKDIEHDWYNWRRIPGVSEFERVVSEMQSKEIFGAVRLPDFADEIKW